MSTSWTTGTSLPLQSFRTPRTPLLLLQPERLVPSGEGLCWLTGTGFSRLLVTLLQPIGSSEDLTQICHGATIPA